jgi:hypothetical protein
MFGQVLDKLDTWFGRAFLLSRYFPCLIITTINALLALAAFPELRPVVSVRPTTMNAVSSVYLTVTRVSGADEAQPDIGFSA